MKTESPETYAAALSDVMSEAPPAAAVPHVRFADVADQLAALGKEIAEQQLAQRSTTDMLHVRNCFEAAILFDQWQTRLDARDFSSADDLRREAAKYAAEIDSARIFIETALATSPAPGPHESSAAAIERIAHRASLQRIRGIFGGGL